jgi:hypothetical protein
VNISEKVEFVDIDDITPDSLAENLANALEETEFLDIDRRYTGWGRYQTSRRYADANS